MSELTSKVIAISVGLVVAAILVPLGLGQIANATGLDNVDPAVITIFQVLLPILAVIGIAMWFMRAD